MASYYRRIRDCCGGSPVELETVTRRCESKSEVYNWRKVLVQRWKGEQVKVACIRTFSRKGRFK